VSFRTALRNAKLTSTLPSSERLLLQSRRPLLPRRPHRRAPPPLPPALESPRSPHERDLPRAFQVGHVCRVRERDSGILGAESRGGYGGRIGGKDNPEWRIAGECAHVPDSSGPSISCALASARQGSEKLGCGSQPCQLPSISSSRTTRASPRSAVPSRPGFTAASSRACPHSNLSCEKPQSRCFGTR
jgi:hypothetical protein